MTTYVPLHRAKILLSLLYKYFDAQLINELSDEIIAQLVGVLPKTIGMVRRSRMSQTVRQSPSQGVVLTSKKGVKMILKDKPTSQNEKNASLSVVESL
jgi:uncharacterized protein (DUF697 family)